MLQHCCKASVQTLTCIKAKDFRTAMRKITQEAEFMNALKIIRNFVAAHHADSKTATMAQKYVGC